ncbi:nucleotide sugar epimerase [Azospirillum sp. TSH7]|uniref:NAD-dependent epimerase/dehydratase family protein n=1 Tax=unclassified Azospirillum TaxID=2630922 RepID=UPI000D6049E8|nr:MULTISPECIES: NAD-dependent epimerase/dehydratase family protein [unclassified Azospirillum]PWC57257.1 nucleotide sugar epimerase [Azospirillum sp. TSH7]PWC71321.1 nucleotide sugar epimerase [Azospirillum sp. TSH20]
MSDSSAFAGSRILVVGGAGFVGSNLCHMLAAQRPEALFIVDNLLSSHPSNLPEGSGVHFVLGSIADDRLLADLPERLDYVFHLACFHGNQSSIADPIADHDNNTITTLKLFDRLSRRRDVKRVVYAGAGCAVAKKTFDGAMATPEDAPVSLSHDSPYSISKLVGEMYAAYYARQHGLPVVTARFQNIYGPREILGAGNWRGTVHSVWRNVIPTFVWKALHGESLPLDNGGIASRDFIFVEDLARGLQACALRGTAGEVYNLASGVETTIRTLAETINRLTGNAGGIDLRPPRPWDNSGQRFGSTEKSRRELGFAAEIGLEDGLARTIDWTRANQDLIRHCMNHHQWFLDHPGAGRWPQLSPALSA